MVEHVAPTLVKRVGSHLHPLRDSSDQIQKLFNERWTDAQKAWRKLLRSEPCNYCGILPYKVMVNHGPDPINTIDHIIPRSALNGNEFYWDNFGTACPKCNSHRGSQGMLWFIVRRRPSVNLRPRGQTNAA